MGYGRPVMHAFVASETVASLSVLFRMFKDMMGQQYIVRTFVMDKLAAQMRAAETVYGCDVLLCAFHVRRAIRSHVSFMRTTLMICRLIRPARGTCSTEWLPSTT